MSARIEDLDPIFQPIARAILAEAQRRIEAVSPGSRILPAVTWRTPADQEAAVASGASILKIGFHNFGRALDVKVLDERGAYVIDGEDPRYTIFGQVAKERGCVWGGDWHRADWDHCELCGGFTVSEFLAWLDAHPHPIEERR